jgi:hypothetical protein
LRKYNLRLNARLRRERKLPKGLLRLPGKKLKKRLKKHKKRRKKHRKRRLNKQNVSYSEILLPRRLVNLAELRKRQKRRLPLFRRLRCELYSCKRLYDLKKLADYLNVDLLH